MTADGHALLALQRLDSEIDAIAARRRRLPELAVVQAAQSDVDRLTSAAAAHWASIAAALASIESLEASGAELDRKQARLEMQLKTIIAPREAEALMHEIDALKAKHGALDDVELEAMEQQSVADDALAALAIERPPVQERLDGAQAALDAVLAAMADEESAVRAQREAAAEALVDADRTLYAATRKQHGSVGFATLERHTCTGCHMDLSQMEFERVIAESKTGMGECPHCGRPLVV